MGTDIQLYAEAKRDGVWHFLGEMEENPEYFPEANRGAPQRPTALYDSRHYNLFAILANVRNPPKRSLEGRAMGDAFEPISLPRGLPPDLSPELASYYESLGDDPPQPSSWLLLSEILRVDWHGRGLSREAMVDARAAHLFTDPTAPFPSVRWPAGVQQGYAAWMQGGVLVRWRETYAQAVGEDVLQMFRGLKRHGKPSRVRLVFWFSG